MQAGPTYQIAILEDSTPDVELLRFLLAQTGENLELHVLPDGAEGSDFLFKRGSYGADTPTPDLVLLDLNMPRKDGRALLAEMKADRTVAKIPVVMLSTSSNPQDVADCYRLGASVFISKPIDLERFQTTIDLVVKFYFSCVRLPSRP